MKNIMNKKQVIIVALILILSITNVLSKTLDVSLFRLYDNVIVESANENYDDSVKTFVIVSGIKAVVAVIEGSSLNLPGTEIEIGDAIQPAYDAIDILWKSTLVSVVVMKFYAIYFAIFTSKIAQLFILAITVVFLLRMGFYTNFIQSRYKKSVVLTTSTAIANKVLHLLISSLIIFYVLVPISIFASQSMMVYFSTTYYNPAVEKLTQTSQELTDAKDQLLSLETESGLLGIVEIPKEVKKDLIALTSEITKTSAVIVSTVPIIILIQILTGVVIPIISIFILYKLIAIILNNILVSKATVNLN